MTVTYSKDVATVRCWTFLRVLFKWRGSIYKLVWVDLAVFVALFTLFSLTYRFAMPPKSKEIFELFCVYCARFENLIPLAFVLGFFVQLIASRWWEQFVGLPYPDNLALMLDAYVVGDEENEGTQPSEPASASSPAEGRGEGSAAGEDQPGGSGQSVRPSPSATKCHVDGGSDGDRGDASQKSKSSNEDRPGLSRTSCCAEPESETDLPAGPETPSKARQAHHLRRTIMRYVNLSLTVTFQRVAYPVKKRIPSEQDLVKLQLMTEDEMRIWNAFQVENKYFLPLIWCNDLIVQATSKGLIKSKYFEHQLLEEIQNIRGKLGMIFTYDYINPPLSYTQAATISVYSYFLACLFGRQFLDPTKKYENSKVDFMVPLFTIFQFLFYVGWLKVAEELINPYGKDDDDFEVLALLKRNKEISAALIDPMVREAPNTEEDLPWDTTDFSSSGVKEPDTKASRNFLSGSAMSIHRQPSRLGEFFRGISRQQSHASSSAHAREEPATVRFDVTSPFSDTTETEMRRIPKSVTPTTVDEVDMTLLADDVRSPSKTPEVASAARPPSRTPEVAVRMTEDSQPLTDDPGV